MAMRFTAVGRYLEAADSFLARVRPILAGWLKRKPPSFKARAKEILRLDKIQEDWKRQGPGKTSDLEAETGRARVDVGDTIRVAAVALRRAGRLAEAKKLPKLSNLYSRKNLIAGLNRTATVLEDNRKVLARYPGINPDQLLASVRAMQALQRRREGVETAQTDSTEALNSLVARSVSQAASWLGLTESILQLEGRFREIEAIPRQPQVRPSRDAKAPAETLSGS